MAVTAAPKQQDQRRGTQRSQERKWRFSWIRFISAMLIWGGLLLFLYPSISAWFSQYNQSLIVSTYADAIDNAEPERTVQLANAELYNNALRAGAVIEAGSNIATSTGSVTDGVLPYWQQLRATEDGLMGRLKIKSIDLDLPFYHGTSDATLLRGLGHLEGTHLPVGGVGTRSVITGHRGLSSATMFTNLDKVSVGDDLIMEVFGEVFTYRVIHTQVVEPHETEAILADPSRDLLTLITCTPLGINSHRILVTGERILPTPLADLQAAGSDPTIPHFPWWALIMTVATALLVVYMWRSGRTRPVRAGSPDVDNLTPGPQLRSERTAP